MPFITQGHLKSSYFSVRQPDQELQPTLVACMSLFSLLPSWNHYFMNIQPFIFLHMDVPQLSQSILKSGHIYQTFFLIFLVTWKISTWDLLKVELKSSTSGMARMYTATPAYLSCMQSTSSEILGWMKHKLESRFPGEISITSDMQMTPSLWQKAKKN